ncbi:CCA tRNA nucleotidyltransferase [Candidatus Eisenbacteria bacterium]|uniref:CCA tRNA nucleotidyltransferase n=1 Tax=Eiseniibacteriota bacterium TaxID=2212470 RepID=A0ABV6YLI2_UNCEI
MASKADRTFEPERLRREIPHGAMEIIAEIAKAGGQTYLVGGCLRDLLLGRSPKDWDIATDLRPDQVKPLFRKVHEVGVAFGTLIVPWRGGAYEVTTLRTEGGYSDSRHPDEVAYTDQIGEDLKRRDFTINAMAWNPRGDQIEDPFNGARDLREQRIRAVGDPVRRFEEDALRLMRAVRFASQLEFDIEEETWQAIKTLSEGLERISVERIRDELNLILLSNRPSRGLLLLQDAGLLRLVLPELEACRGVEQNRFHAHDVFMHSLYAIDAAPAGNLDVRLAALLHDIAKPDTREERNGDYTFYAHQVVGARKVGRILRRLRYPNDVRERVTHLVYHHMFYYEPHWTDSAVRRFARTVGLDDIPDLIQLRLADMAGNKRKSSDTRPLQALLSRVDEVIAKDTALSVKDLAIGGRELMELGLAEGPGIGRILRALLEKVLDDPDVNTPEALLDEARALLESGYHLRPEPQSSETPSE